MASQRPESPGSVTSETLMRYLDGELTPDERRSVEAGLAASTELQRDLAIYQSMKSDIQDLHFHPATHRGSVWDQVNARLNRPIGWLLVIAGVVIWMIYGTYVFATSPVSPWEKMGTGAIAIGVLMLLASVIWERLRELETDPYRDVQR